MSAEYIYALRHFSDELDFLVSDKWNEMNILAGVLKRLKHISIWERWQKTSFTHLDQWSVSTKLWLNALLSW